eukprot:TRINITY_DN65996_c0_g1_i1.p2 TRINITY_DN65996_c0_g1~~TRINITY_DN65996_c0_g1_i1.p2  ORF type:complete len:356 (+),score=100.37 TRINITY_DN65996_c0_g1_i1:71-1069(+)
MARGLQLLCVVAGAGAALGDCIALCAAESAAGCCALDTASGACQWHAGGHVAGGQHAQNVQSANCYSSGKCDGWNAGVPCSGGGVPVPPPAPSPPTKWKLVWADEFDACPNGRPDPKNWGYEHGFVRNHEAQWYQQDNAACVNGSLVITARREHPAEQPSAEYTSSSLTSKGKQEWAYGRFEMRGKIDIRLGSWPAWWVLGDFGQKWPLCGEIDIMEYYRGTVLANFDYANSKGQSVWNSKKTPVDAAWAAQWHTWAMEWNNETITLWRDGAVVNTESVAVADGQGHPNPWRGKPVFMIINQAIGGQSGGDPSKTQFPVVYEVDYVRVYQQA